MIDAIVKKAVEEALRFVRVGAVEHFEINTHALVFVRLLDDRFLVACTTCRALLDDETARPFMVAHEHTKLEEGHR